MLSKDAGFHNICGCTKSICGVQDLMCLSLSHFLLYAYLFVRYLRVCLVLLCEYCGLWCEYST